MTQGERRLAIRSELTELGRLFALIDDFCSELAVPPDIRLRLRLVAEELVVNVITHGHAGRTDGRIEVDLRRSGGEGVEIEIADDAPAFDPLIDAPTPALGGDLTHRHVGGLGVFLAKQAAALRYHRRDGGWNVITGVVLVIRPEP